jgi:hypothetical protein
VTCFCFAAKKFILPCGSDLTGLVTGFSVYEKENSRFRKGQNNENIINNL